MIIYDKSFDESNICIVPSSKENMDDAPGVLIEELTDCFNFKHLPLTKSKNLNNSS
jgi:hypothetical protein